MLANTSVATLPVQLLEAVELFPVGEVSYSPEALASLRESKCDRDELLRQHQCGTLWAEQPHLEMDNLAAITNGQWIASSFDLQNGRTLWFFTEPSRATTIAELEEP
jgi:hypothetical protein